MALLPRNKNSRTSKERASSKEASATGKKKTTRTRNARPSKTIPPVFQPQQNFQAIPTTVNPETSTQPNGHPYEPPRELPWSYGDNHIYVLIRDPYWLYSYWEIQKDHQDKILGKLGGSWDHVVSVLRVYDITDRKINAPFFDILLQNMASCWYINVQPNRSYVVEIGLLHKDGRFVALARSNEVTTPRAGMSEIIDEQWMGLDFDKMYALSGGFQVGKSSMELKKLMEERLRGAISSGSGAGVISSMASPVKIKKRGFYFWLECELIIYGGTEPDATVTMQGRPVKLRPDGTFTLRYALPDGKFVFDAHAHSADGVEERVITPIVARNTERPAPVFKTGKKK